jgi:hypothetical protein
MGTEEKGRNFQFVRIKYCKVSEKFDNADTIKLQFFIRSVVHSGIQSRCCDSEEARRSNARENKIANKMRKNHRLKQK